VEEKKEEEKEKTSKNFASRASENSNIFLVSNLWLRAARF